MRTLLASLILIATAADALACSCMPMTREQTIAASDLVVKGTIEDSDFNPKDANAMRVTSHMRVAERIKGTSEDIITVTTAGQSAACGISLPKGAAVELALRKMEDGTYHASSCPQMGLSDGHNPNINR